MNTVYRHVSRKIILCLALFVSLIFCTTVQAQKKGRKQIQFSADIIEGSNKHDGKDARRMLGHVVFTQDSVIMYCDSAWLYPDNSLDAYSHVHIKQGDSLNLFGDLLKYDGNKKFARLEKNIHLADKDMTLTTEHMTYDVGIKKATYFSGGTIVSKENILTSETGYYFASGRMLAFKKKVLLTNPRYTVTCDTLNYHTASRTAYFFGPTWIRSSRNSIYCENGFYNTDKDIAQFTKNAVIHSGHQGLKGDSVFYNNKTGYGKALGHITVTDSSQHLVITGDYATNNQSTNISYVTGHALMSQIFQKDTLLLHGDSLKGTAVTDSAALQKMRETRYRNHIQTDVPKDSIPMIRTMYAYHKVKFYQPQIQGRCDSLIYSYKDSTMHMFIDPILWSSDNQMTAELIELSTGNGEMKLLKLFNSSFIISKEDSIRFNQIKGKNMIGYFHENKLRKVYVEGNGQTIYYAKEKNKKTGVNKADCSDLLLYLKNNQIESITLLNKPDGTIYPPAELDPKELRLKDFKDRMNLRPKTKADLFVW